MSRRGDTGLRVVVYAQQQTSKYVQPLYDAEKLLREIASFLQEAKATPGMLRKSREKIRHYEAKLYDLFDEISDAGEALDKQTAHVPLVNKFHSLLDDYHTVASTLFDLMKDLHDCTEELCEAILTKTDELRSTVNEHIKGECAFNPSSRDLALVANDVASCIHRFADWLTQNVAGESMPDAPKCYILAGANESIKEACKEWNKISDYFNSVGLYQEVDYTPLQGVAQNDRLYLRVGSAGGHATELNLKEGKIRYYDYDMPVNIAMEELFEAQAEVACSLKEDGVECSDLTENNIEDAARAAAAATSMDFRIRHPASYWRRNAETNEVYDSALNVRRPDIESQAMHYLIDDWISKVRKS
jgi:hypothetical protein